MSKIMVALIDIENEEGYLEYQNSVLPMFVEMGIEVLAVDDTPKAIEGNTRDQRMVVIKFEDEEAFYNWYDSPEYQKIKPGLSPAVWLIHNKFCNLELFGFSYFNSYFWLQMFVGTALVLKYLNFSYFESLILSTGLNLSLLDMIRTGNYGYIVGIVMVICLKNLSESKNETLNIILLSIVTFLKIQYILIISLFFILNKFLIVFFV